MGLAAVSEITAAAMDAATDADTILSGSCCSYAAVADAAETTTETAVAASKSKSNLTTHHLYDKKPGAVMPPVLSVSSYI